MIARNKVIIGMVALFAISACLLLIGIPSICGALSLPYIDPHSLPYIDPHSLPYIDPHSISL
jgi:hypothetical protein